MSLCRTACLISLLTIRLLVQSMLQAVNKTVMTSLGSQQVQIAGQWL